MRIVVHERCHNLSLFFLIKCIIQLNISVEYLFTQNKLKPTLYPGKYLYKFMKEGINTVILLLVNFKIN